MATRSQYVTYSLIQLQNISRERQLPISGTKAKLILRLMEDDSAFAFPFLKLPGEIRNKIYKYVTTFQKPLKKGAMKAATDRRELPHHVCAGDLHNQASIAQPKFFHTCSQIYQESRASFYGCREFKLHIWQDPGKKRHSRCLGKVFNWLDIIGVDMQKQIRTLEVDLQCDKSTDLEAYTWFVDNLHARLSDKATVLYRPIWQTAARHDVAFLWRIGKILHTRDPRRVPRFEHPNWSIQGSPTPGNDANIWASARNPLVYTPKTSHAKRPSLTFGPDRGWFGRDAGTDST